MKKNIIRLLLFLSFFPLVSTAQALFSQNGTDWKIYVSERICGPEIQAYEELKRVLEYYLKGQKNERKRSIEVIFTNRLPQGRGIVIGSLESPLTAGLGDRLNLKKSEDDEIANYILDGNLYLVGNTPRATLFAVYSFIQRIIGVRWLWPGIDGEFFPPRKDLYLDKDMAYNYIPAFRHRTMPLGHGADVELWTVRNFLQAPGFLFGGDRYYGAETVQPKRSDYKDHPEYFAEIKGKRYLPPEKGWSWVINGCWSNEEFTKLCLERIRTGLVENYANHISLHPADDQRRCECDKCAKLNPDRSSRWFQYNAKLIRELKKDFPNLKYSVIAYQEYKNVPIDPVEEVAFVEYCQYDRCFVHKFSQENCRINARSLERLNRWINEKGVPMGIYGYEFDIFPKAPGLPLWELFDDEMKYFRNKKLVKVMTEWGTATSCYLARYIYAQLAWNPDADLRKLMAEYCQYAFGPGAKFMMEYYNACAKTWDSMNMHISNCFNNIDPVAKLYVPALNDIAEQAFSSAESAVNARIEDETMKKSYLNSIRLEREAFDEWRKHYNKSMKLSESVKILKLDGNKDFASCKSYLMTKDPKKTDNPPKTELRMYWTDNALHFQVVCFGEGKGTDDELFPVERDDEQVFKQSSIELYIQPPNVSTYYHFALARNGSIYDAETLDSHWNADWKSEVLEGKKQWTATLSIPFKSLGVLPEPDQKWKMVILRNSQPVPVGFPAPLYHCISNGIDLILTNENQVNPVLIPPETNPEGNVQEIKKKDTIQ